MKELIKENVNNKEMVNMSIGEFEKEYKNYLKDSYIDYIKQGSRNPLSLDSYIEVAYKMDLIDLQQGKKVKTNSHIYYIES